MTGTWKDRRRTLLLTAPVLLYLLVLFAVALTVRPPLLGWVGLAIVSVVALSISALGMYLWPRSRVNIDRLHPHPFGPLRLLVVLDADVDPKELAAAVAGRAGTGQVDVHIVATKAGHLTRALRVLPGPRAHVEGKVGAEDPLEATGDELLTFPADEILFVGRPPEQRRLFDEGFERQARDLFGVHCTPLAGR